jgi:hypothetical protein
VIVIKSDCTNVSINPIQNSLVLATEPLTRDNKKTDDFIASIIMLPE